MTRCTGTARNCAGTWSQEGQAYVLRVPKNFRITLRDGTVLACEDAVTALLKAPRNWEVRSAGKGIEGRPLVRVGVGQGTAPPSHSLLIRRHLKTGELAFHYCYVPEGQLCTMTRLARAAGLRWPVEERVRASRRDCFGLDQSQVRLYHAIARHAVLVMAALAICAVTAALLPHRTDTPDTGTVPTRPGTTARFGLIPLTVPQVRHLLAAETTPAWPPGRRRALGRMDPQPPVQRHDGSTNAPSSTSRHRVHPGQLAKCDCRTGAAAALRA